MPAVALLIVVVLLVAALALWALRAELLAHLPGAAPAARTGTTRLRLGAPQLGPSARLTLTMLLVLAAAVAVLMRVLPPPAQDEFIVLVAPFQDRGGAQTQTGRTAAERLVALLPSATGGAVRAALAERAPADEADARALLAARGADALVWGEISPGGMLDGETLTPHLAYLPTGAYAPNGWDGYTGRFALPLRYTLADRPLNGAVVLPALLRALADYGADRPDAAAAALERLQGDYSALRPALPAMLIGNLLWARGETAAAAASYQRAIAAAEYDDSPPQAAQLLSNLGAILQDGGDPAARAALNQAADLLNQRGADLGQLHYNLGRAYLATGDTAAALERYQAAQRLLPDTSALLIELGAAYRLTGRLDGDAEGDSSASARSVEQRTEGQVVRDIDTAPPELRTLDSARLRGRAALEQALLGLASELRLRGPLLWGLQARGDLSQRTLGDLRRLVDSAVKLAESRARGWSARAAAEDAAGRPLAGLIAAQQSRIAERDLREARRWQAAIAIEQGESQHATPPQGIGAIWSGLLPESAPLGEARRTLEALIEVDPRDRTLHLLLAHDLLARGELELATGHFQIADDLAPQRPEAPYGLALARLADQKTAEDQRAAEARALLQRALERDAGYFPARMQLARLAEAASDWPLAIEQRRRLAAEQPGVGTTLQLAQALRRAGPAYFAEAEKLLLPLANSDNIDALVELSAIYRDYGDQKSQQMVLEKAQRKAPRNVEVAYDLGVIAAARGDRYEAERQLRVALAADRAHIPSLMALAALNADQPRIATDLYRQALDAGANDVATLRTIGASMLDDGQPELALRAFTRAAEIGVDDPRIQRGIARANLELRRLEEAEQAGGRALELAAGDPETLTLLGQIAFARERFDQARERFSAALAADPQRAEAHIGLGRAVATGGEWSVATGHFRNAIAVDPRSAEARLWYGEGLIRQGDIVASLDAYLAAVELRPDYPEAHFGAAQARLALGQVDAADESLIEALRLRPAYAEALLLRGKLYELRGSAGNQAANERRALELYTAAIEANRSLPEPHYRRALLLIRGGRLDDARRELETALQIQPSYPEATYWIGRVDFAGGRYREALARFQQAIEQAASPYPEARFYQGLAEEQLGMRAAAVASFQATIDTQDTTWAGEARLALTRLGTQ